MTAIVGEIAEKDIKRGLRNLFLTPDLCPEDRAFVEKEIDRAAPEIARACRFTMAGMK